MADILIVDDNSAIRLAYRLLLQTVGHTITEAPDGQEAIAKLEVMRFDLVITDLWMPGVDGFTVIAEAKRINTKGLVLAVTGGTLGATADDPGVRARVLGADAVIEKPMLGEGFLTTIAELLRHGAVATP